MFSPQSDGMVGRQVYASFLKNILLLPVVIIAVNI